MSINLSVKFGENVSDNVCLQCEKATMNDTLVKILEYNVITFEREKSVLFVNVP